VYIGRTHSVTRTILNHADTVNRMYIQMCVLSAFITGKTVCEKEYAMGYVYKNYGSDTGVQYTNQSNPFSGDGRTVDK
jgi:hypothetical protein